MSALDRSQLRSPRASLVALALGSLSATGCVGRDFVSPPTTMGVLEVEVGVSGPAALTGRSVGIEALGENGIRFGGGSGRRNASVVLQAGSYSVTASLEFTSPPPTRLRFPLRCSWRDANPRPATITAQERTVLWFTADCTPPGGVMVTTATTGAGERPTGFIVWVEEASRLREPGYEYDDATGEYIPVPYAGEPVTANGFVSIDLSVGTHEVELRGLPPHCSVAGGPKQRVAIQEDVLTYLNLRIRCE